MESRDLQPLVMTAHFNPALELLKPVVCNSVAFFIFSFFSNGSSIGGSHPCCLEERTRPETFGPIASVQCGGGGSSSRTSAFVPITGGNLRGVLLVNQTLANYAHLMRAQ